MYEVAELRDEGESAVKARQADVGERRIPLMLRGGGLRHGHTEARCQDRRSSFVVRRGYFFAKLSMNPHCIFCIFAWRRGSRWLYEVLTQK